MRGAPYLMICLLFLTIITGKAVVVPATSSIASIEANRSSEELPEEIVRKLASQVDQVTATGGDTEEEKEMCTERLSHIAERLFLVRNFNDDI